MSVRLVRASSQYLRIASAPVTAAPLTMACWFYPVDFTNFQVLMSINNSSSSFNNFRFDFAGNTGGNPIVATAWGSEGVSGGQSSVGANGTSAWYHAVAVYTSTTSRTAYFNGGNAGTDTNTRTPSGLNDTEIGSYRFGASAPEAFFDGWIAYPTIWNVALNAGEVWALSRGTPPWRIRPWAIVSCQRLVQSFRDDRALTWTANGGAVIAGKEPRIIRPRRRVEFVAAGAPASTTYPQLERNTRGLLRGVALGRAA